MERRSPFLASPLTLTLLYIYSSEIWTVKGTVNPDVTDRYPLVYL